MSPSLSWPDELACAISSSIKVGNDQVSNILTNDIEVVAHHHLCLSDTKVVYRRYASLFFIAATDPTDNELITLEIVHRYVEQMDKYYGNVCELDIIFNFQKAYFILDELLLAGEMQESSKKNVLRVIGAQDSLEDMEVRSRWTVRPLHSCSILQRCLLMPFSCRSKTTLSRRLADHFTTPILLSEDALLLTSPLNCGLVGNDRDQPSA